MNVIAIFDDKNYDEAWERYERIAVRAIIIRNKKIALVKSNKKGFYKFPGGGIKNGENHCETLIRETREETGLKVIPASITPFGMIHEVRKSHYQNEIFDQKSYYYFAEIENEMTTQDLDQYEDELGFVLEWTTIEDAFEIDAVIGKKYEDKFILREVKVLEILMNHYFSDI